MLSLEEARDRLLAAVRSVTERETVPLRDGLDRILAEDLLADRAVPPADNSAMDGYALRCADCRRKAHWRWPAPPRRGRPSRGHCRRGSVCAL